MIPLRIAVLASLVSSATLSFAADTSHNVNVVVCQPNHCIHHTIFGHDYRLLNSDRFAVMVSLSNEGRYTRADVSITNLTGSPATLSPEDFRIEALTPKSKVFPYVPPSQLDSLPITTPAPPANPNPELSELEAARQREAREVAELAAATPHLKAITIPPNQAVHGRVYFERDPATTRQPVNIVLPIADTVFKFPDVIKP
jgi:hypothetical protein